VLSDHKSTTTLGTLVHFCQSPAVLYADKF